jgi:hypothetical protein
MKPYPTDLKSNLATWAVPLGYLPAVARVMLGTYSPEPFDPAYRGQSLETTYFDTQDQDLRKARLKGAKYITLRLRGYSNRAWALSVKTEFAKSRIEVSADVARLLLASDFSQATPWSSLLPADLFARLVDLTDEEPLGAVVTVCSKRYAVEDDKDRMTLDADVYTDTNRRLSAAVLEFKSTDRNRPPPEALASIGLRPIKLSKFLWATNWR